MNIGKPIKNTSANIANPAYFKSLFEKHYLILVNFAAKFLNSQEEAKDVVQQFFIKLWEKREKYLNRELNKSFFYTSVKNACINYLEKKGVKGHLLVSEIPEVSDVDFFGQIVANEKEIQLFKIINDLPPRCKEIFHLNRFENLTYKQISEKMGISIKTVEAQMNTALSRIRKNYKPD